jgi:putative sterol carrier protein
MDAVIQFKFMGEESGEWFAVIKDGKCMVQQGVHPSPTTTLTTDSSQYITIVTGELNGMQAYMEGKIKVMGDLTSAINLVVMFK